MNGSAQRKRAAPDRATRYQTTANPHDTATTGVQQAAAFVVVCAKSSGRSVLFQTYRTLIEAESVAARLRAVGCAATVEAKR
jgi:hypothetical protein